MNMAVPPSDKPIVSPVLVGRTWEMETLERALDAVQRSTGQCIVIAGDAGVGKSRLLSEIRQRAGAERFLTLQGYCFEQDFTFPYAPLVDALRTYLAQRPPTEIRETLGPLASEIVKLVPELALILPDLQSTPTLDPEAEKRRLFESLARFFIRLAAAQPLLLILEDLHWSDKISLDFLQLFARRLSAHSILLLASYRREEASPHVTQLLAQFDRERLAHEITLSPLTRADVGAMLRAIFNLGYPVKAEFLDLLYPLTEGNPFWIEEVLKALVATGEIFYTDEGWERKPIEELHIPRSVQDAVRRRTEQLGAVEQEVLTLAAVVGRRFGFALLREATGMPEHDLLRVIKRLIAGQLVIEESTEQFAFRHALTRQAIYATLLQRERRALHQRVAETFEHVYAEASDVYESELAYHYYAAGVWTKALEYARRAGEKAQALYAPHEASAHFTRALEAVQRMSLPPPMEILRARGKAYETVGYFEAARGDYEKALSAAREAHADAAAWQGLIDLGFLWASRDYAQAGAYFQQALELAREFGEPSTLAHSLNRMGNWYANSEQPDEALRHHHEALTIFQAADDPRSRAETFDLLGMASFLSGDLHHCALYYEQAISIFRALDRRQELASTLATLAVCGPTYQLSVVVPAARTLAEFVRVGEEAVRVAQEIGWRSGETYALGTLAQCLGARGAYAHAMELAQAAVAVAEEIAHRQWLAHAHWVAGMLALDLLDLPQAKHHLEHALALGRAAGSWHWIRNATAFLAMVSIAEGDLAGATAVLDEALNPDAPALTLGQRLCWCVRTELALARHDPNLALQIIERLLASAANLSGERVIPRLWKLHGEALASLGKFREAEAALLAAREAARAQGARPLLWRIRVALGKLYQAQSRRDEAETEFSAASEMIRTLAANVPDEGLRHNFIDQAMAASPRLPTLSSRHAEKMKYGGLTVREREVAGLIAQGKANRKIADELVVGLRTVEAHITRIFNKLGFSSRAQIAVWAVEKGLARAAPDDKS